MKQIRVFIIIISVIGIFSFYNFSFARYVESVLGKASCELKYPIFKVENSDEIQGKISSINNNYYESDFNVLNYISEEEINEIEFEYTIRIVPNTLEFPVKYKLININTNEELALNSNLETEKIDLGKDLENHNYKLIVQWDTENTNQNFDENLEVKVVIEGEQKR